MSQDLVPLPRLIPRVDMNRYVCDSFLESEAPSTTQRSVMVTLKLYRGLSVCVANFSAFW